MKLQDKLKLALTGYDNYLSDSKDFDGRENAKAYIEIKEKEGKIIDHLTFLTIKMNKDYKLIVFEECNDNQYYANSGLTPNRILQCNTHNDVTYMVCGRG